VSNSSWPAEYWSGPSKDGTVFMVLNPANETRHMTFNLTESPWIRAGRKYTMHVRAVACSYDRSRF
jgi:alpha-galactosidase